MSFKSSLYTLGTNPLLNVWFANMFSQCITFLFILLTGFFTEQEFLVSTHSSFSIFFSCYGQCFWCEVKQLTLHLALDLNYFLFFSPKSLLVLYFTFKSVIHVELIFVKCVRFGLRLISLPLDVHLLSHPLLKRLSLLDGCSCIFVKYQLKT